MWRTTPISRSEEPGGRDDALPPQLPAGVSRDELQPIERGVGPVFRRTYRTRIADARCSARRLIEQIAADPNVVAPTEFARFFKVDGHEGRLEVGDEFVVRMPGPWDGPVRVVESGPTWFRFATLDGHLEAGQIEFRAFDDGELVFEIESWARSGDRLSGLLFDRVRIAKEVQLHMWVSVLERVARLAGGRRKGADSIETLRVDMDD